MTWLQEVTTPADHPCPLPIVDGQLSGSRWACDGCRAVWTLSSPFGQGGTRTPNPLKISNVYRQQHGPDGSLWYQKRKARCRG